MKKLLLLTILFCPLFYAAYCQISTITRYCDVDVLTIAEKKLIPILDSVLIEERTRDYYRSDLLFDICFCQDSTIEIQAMDFLFMPQNGTADNFGFVKYGGHYFFVSGKYFDNNIFHNTGKTKRFKYYTDFAYKKEDGQLVFLQVEDEKYSSWIYRYNGENFKLHQFINTSRVPFD